MRRWFGVTLLGGVAFLVGLVGFTAVHRQGPGLPWPALAAEFVLFAAEVLGLVAVIVGLAGAGITAVRPSKGRRTSS